MAISGYDLKIPWSGQDWLMRWRNPAARVVGDGWIYLVMAAAAALALVSYAPQFLPVVYVFLVLEATGEFFRIMAECNGERIVHGRRAWRERAALSPRVLTGLTGGLVLVFTWPLLPLFYFGLVGPVIGQPTTWAMLVADVALAYSARSVVLDVPIPGSWLVVGMCSAGATWCQFALLRRSPLVAGLTLPAQLALSLLGACVIFGEGHSLRDGGLALLAITLVGLVMVRPTRAAFTLVDAAMVAALCMCRLATCVMVRGLDLPHDRHDLVALCFRAASCSVYLAPAIHLLMSWRALHARAAREMPYPGRGIALAALASVLSAAGSFCETIATSHSLSQARLLESGMLVLLLTPMTALYGTKYDGHAKARLRQAWREMGRMRQVATVMLAILLVVWYVVGRAQ